MWQVPEGPASSLDREGKLGRRGGERDAKGWRMGGAKGQTTRPQSSASTAPIEHPTQRGMTIPKPGQDDYSLAKSYRCISLLNCLGKMVEKVAAMLVSAHCERARGFHPGQYGPDDRRWMRWG